MSRNYLNSDEFRRYDQQFAERMDERNARLRKARLDRLAQGIVSREASETPSAARPEGQEPGPKDAPNE